ncbi:minor capsid protein [Thermoactinomyces sp. DSM 45892]|uniref:minor capsid protein n=1 Tax=Thermoactinomyces sp. DSM 45892 TaxID=1882753 RepID=UPI00089C8EA2|nr:minor capsid protein [Thermoactinomyces sp. DSM 45892]SDZ00963.1 hypothetical protein SAMN05444416_111111 [Thermoactinomyces sp. DSM 45892]
MTILEQIARFLQAKELGFFDADGTKGTIFIHSMPSDPHNAIAIYATGGGLSELMDQDGDVIRRDVQILVRGLNSKETFERTYRVYRTLHNFCGYLVTNGNYVSSLFSYPPSGIGTDQNGRYEFTINLSLRMEELSNG